MFLREAKKTLYQEVSSESVELQWTKAINHSESFVQDWTVSLRTLSPASPLIEALPL